MNIFTEFVAYLNGHRHVYEFAGKGESKESAWYWHFEECRWCPKRREVMDTQVCACGYNNNAKERAL